MADTDTRALPAATKTAAPNDKFSAEIDAWFNDSFPGSPIARDTDSWNVLFAAIAALKTRLAALSGA